MNIIRKLRDRTEQEHYIVKIAKETDSSIQPLLERLDKGDVLYEKERRELNRINPVASDPEAFQDNLLAVAVLDSSTHDLFRQVDSSIFTGEERQAVVNFLKDNGGKAIKDTPEELIKYDIYVKILLLKADARYIAWNDQDRYFEAARLIRQVINEHKKKQKDILTNQLRDAEAEGDDEKAKSICTQLNQLIKEIQSGQR